MIKKFALWETKHPKKIIIIALLLIIPSLIGFAFTRVNYDIMSYLPDTDRKSTRLNSSHWS